MQKVENTVFISYRRTNIFTARAVYQNLTSKGYDVFFDFKGINIRDFEHIILGNLRARAHFLVILTPSALERCNQPGDWFRREIESAIDERRNIISLFFEGFSFSSPSIEQYLTGNLETLKNYKSLTVPSDYFNEAMDKLTNRFLNMPLNTVLHPLSSIAKNNVETQKSVINKTPSVTEDQLSAEEWFEKGNRFYDAKDYIEAIHCYTESVNLEPKHATTYNNRGNANKGKGDLHNAIKDYTEAIRLEPNHAIAYFNRGTGRSDMGDLDGAIKDLVVVK